MSSSKPTEFWIWGFKIGPDESISQDCTVHLDSGGSEYFSPVHHVIEKSAFDKLVEELKKKDEIINRLTSGNKNMIDAFLETKIDKLKSVIEKLKLLLKEHHDWHLDFGKVPKSFVGMDLGAEYCDSDFYTRTSEALKELAEVEK